MTEFQEAVLTLVKREVRAGRPFPDTSQLAKRLDREARQVKDALDSLCVKGHVRVASRYRDENRRWRCVYEIVRK